MKKDFKKIFRAENVVTAIVFVFFFLYAISLLFPLFWAFLGAVKNPDTYYKTMGTLFPDGKWFFSNFVSAFELLVDDRTGTNIYGMIWNTVWLGFGRTLISVFVCSMTAYVIARYDFVGKKLVYTTAVVSMILPIFGNLASTYRLYEALGMLDSPLILMASASGFGQVFLILLSYYKTLAKEYSEAAELDGAGFYYIYLFIMVPLAMPSILSISLVAFLGAWQDYTTSLYYLPSYPTLMTGLFNFSLKVEHQSGSKPAYLAGLIISCIVPVALFTAFQDIIMKSISTGGLKG